MSWDVTPPSTDMEDRAKTERGDEQLTSRFEISTSHLDKRRTGEQQDNSFGDQLIERYTHQASIVAHQDPKDDPDAKSVIQAGFETEIG